MRLKIYLRSILLGFLCAAACGAQTQSGQIELTVTDQNGQPLPAATVNLEQSGKPVSQQRTTPSGIVDFRGLTPGAYSILVQKQGFYSASFGNVEVAGGESMPVEVRLQPVREYREEVEVTAQPSPIDPEEPATTASITASDISNIPYPTTRDYRNVMAFIPGVVADTGAQIHLAGSSSQEVQDYLDGFEVSQPAGGGLGLRLNPDSLRKIEVRSSRYSARFGKGSGGLADLEVQDGDNRFRYNATDFIPTFQSVKGLHFNNWTPRAYISGPIVRDRIWFDLSHEGENDLDIVKELPAGADANHIWRTADLGRVRMNLTPGNVLTASALINLFDSENSGLSPFDPLSVSFNQHSTLDLYTLKDQVTVARNTLLEFGAGFHRTRNATLPLGPDTYTFLPTGRTGNFYLTSRTVSERSQGFSNLFLKPVKLLGTHQFTFGGSLDRIIFDGHSLRRPIQFLDGGGALLRQINFQNIPFFSLSTQESSAYAQDRWSGFQSLAVEAGARWDRDSFTGRNVYSPRIAGALLISEKSETKLSAGIGIYHDRANLSPAAQALQGSRTDVFFSPTALVLPAVFVVHPTQLALPRFVNWSAGLERRLPWRIYSRMDFISRHGNHVWAYESQPDGTYLLQDRKTDRYDAAQITLRKDLKRGYPIVLAYTRSRARSNESLTFSLDDFTTGPQLSGPLLWDAPNLVQSWGSLPLFWKFKKFDFMYSLLWRSGFPFATVDQFGRLVEGPEGHRFPDFVTLDPAIERKFAFHGYRWAARVGIENITNSPNPTGVDNNVTSPTFLDFFGLGRRTLNGRIRFLGKL